MKIINGNTIHIEKKCNYVVGRYNTGSKKMYLNLNVIDKVSEMSGVEFEYLLTLIIGHEYLHKLLDITEGEDACNNWDNISNGFQKYGCV